MIGTELADFLSQKGFKIIKFGREDVQTMRPERLDGLYAIVHLAGENISDGRWSKERKEKILRSRTESTAKLYESISKSKNKPKIFICASAVGIYGDRGDEILDEDSSPGAGFLPEVCKAWEAEARKIENLGLRVVRMRFGVVLSPQGGALKKILGPFKYGLGAPLGSGDQWMSWIGLKDLVSSILFCLERNEITGIVNAVSPHPVTNKDFSQTLATILHRPVAPAVPSFVLKMIFGEMASETVLASARVLPKILMNAGFDFSQPLIESSLRHMLKETEKARA